MKKILKYILVGGLVLVALRLSLKIEGLQEYRAAHQDMTFDAEAYALNFWEEALSKSIQGAPELTILIQALDQDPVNAFQQYGRKLGISTTAYFFLKGTALVESVEEEYLWLVVNEEIRVRLATDFIFGNAVRDGSGLVDISDFVNMTDFNQCSVEINALIKERIVPGLRRKARPGMRIDFAGAMEINETAIATDSLLIIPVKAKLSHGEES